MNIKFQQPDSKEEALFQGFVLLFQTGHPEVAKYRGEMIQLMTALLNDPDITVEVAQACCDRAVNVLSLEKQMNKKNTGKDHP